MREQRYVDYVRSNVAVARGDNTGYDHTGWAAYKACALAAARRFAPSGETAPVIADAALADYASSRRALAAAFAANPKTTSTAEAIALDTVDRQLWQQLQLEVVRAKARH